MCYGRMTKKKRKKKKKRKTRKEKKKKKRKEVLEEGTKIDEGHSKISVL